MTNTTRPTPTTRRPRRAAPLALLPAALWLVFNVLFGVVAYILGLDHAVQTWVAVISAVVAFLVAPFLRGWLGDR